jgi:hypothetical protein
MPVTKRPARSLFTRKRYWYHVSTTLTKRIETLVPWGGRRAINRDPLEPVGKRICVAPTIEQCIIAIPYHYGADVTIYRTEEKELAIEPRDVFDAKVTHEGWLTKATRFIKLGTLDFEEIEKALGVEHVIDEPASHGELPISRTALRWWKRAKIHRFIKST